MATDLGRNKSAPTAEYENRVRSQLAGAEKRIRTLDLASSLLTFAAATLAYAVVAALLDRWLNLSAGVRQAGLVVYLLAAAGYLTAFVFLPLSRRINPYFAARQLERTLPDAKNSVVNWLDLRDQNLPPAIRGAVGRRAAKVLDGADPEKAVSGRRAWTAGGVAAVCAVAFVVALFLLGFRPFIGSLGRAFAPFDSAGANGPPTNTRITVVKPVDGNAVVADDRPVDVLVRVDGRVPDPKAADALKLLFRNEPSAPYRQRLMEPDDGGRWGVTLPAADVLDGFWYKVTGGDAETPEYRVRLTPRVLDFKAVYTFRPYVARPKETRTERKIEALRGTQVDVTIHANRDVKDGWLQFDGPNGATVTHGDSLPGDPQGFVVHLTLDQSSPYRICFTSAEGESFVESQAFPLIAVPDKPPEVTLTKPVELKDKPGWVPPLQADGLLELEGLVTDDIGVAEMWLNLQVEGGPTLPKQEYRSRKDFQLTHGGNPTTVDYKDFVDLAKLRGVPDPTFAVRPGMVLEYWLTAEDACDYPDPQKPNIGESKHYRVLIVAPLNNDKVQKEQQDKAEADKKDHDQKQDQQFKQQDEKHQQGDKGDQQGDGSTGDADKPKDDANQQPKPGDDTKPGMGEDKPGDKPQDGNNPNPQNQGDKSNNPNPDQGNKNDAAGKEQQQKVDDAAKQIRKDEEGTEKTDPQQHPADGKDAGQEQKQPKPADGKDGGKQEGKDAADSKAGPQNPPGNQHDESAGKPEGQPDPKQPQQGEGKPGGDPKAAPDAQAGQDKDGKTEAPPQPSETKDGGKPDGQQQAGSEKPQRGPADDQGANAEKKEGNPPNPSADARPAGDAKDKAAPETKADAKGAGPENPDKDAAKSDAKGDGTKGPMDHPMQASPKDGGEKPDNQNVAQNKSDEGSGDKPPQDDGKPQSVDDAFKKLKDDLKSPDPERRKLAEDFIRQYLQHADDPDIRDKAKKTLQDAGLNPDDDKQPATGKPEEAAKAKDGPPTAPKDKPADDKPGPDNGPQTTAKDNPPEDPKKDADKGESKGEGPPNMNDPMGPPPPATPKGIPGKGTPGQPGSPPPNNDTAVPPPTPETPLAQKASVLQLLKFYQVVPKDVLKDVMADPEKLKALQAAANAGQEELPGPQQGGPLTNVAGKTSNPNNKPPTDDPDAGGRPQPPPGYRDPYKEFTKLLSPGGDK